MNPFSPGMVLDDRFELRTLLGRSATAAVYEAFDRVRGELIALKLLHSHLTRDPIMAERLRREVQAAARIRHPNALVALDLHRVGGRLAISLPLFSGVSLKATIEAHGALAVKQLIRLGLEVGGALREAHRQGVLHRDVTPTNVLVGTDEHFALSDFGLARVEAMKTVTATAALGTCGYSAPELYHGERGDATSDVYSLGAVLYFAASGQGPFEAAGPVASLSRQLKEDFVPLQQRRPELPYPLTALIDRCLTRDPGVRPSGVQTLLEALEQLQSESGSAVAPGEELQAHNPEILPLPAGSWTVYVEVPGQEAPERSRAGMLELVAGVCELPARALPAPPAVMERSFRLVEGVSEDCARRLTGELRDRHFVAQVFDADPRAVPSFRDWLRRLDWYSALIVFMVWAGISGRGTPAHSGLVSTLFLSFVCFFAGLVPLKAHLGRRRRLRAPVAFLSEASAFSLPAGSSRKTNALPSQSASNPALLPPARDPQAAPLPEGARRLRRLAGQVNRRLHGLELRLESARQTLSSVACQDLRGLLAELRVRIEGLTQEGEATSARLSSLREDLAEEASLQLSQDLRRIETRQSLGLQVEPGELETLRAALATHGQTIARAFELETAFTRLQAELLEIDAAAVDADTRLARASLPDGELEPLLQGLRACATAAGLALEEVSRVEHGGAQQAALHASK